MNQEVVTKLVNDGRIFRRQLFPAKDVRDLFLDVADILLYIH